MSKTIIREIDNTKVPSPEYANFSVVVPGSVGLKIDPEVSTLTETEAYLTTEADGIYWHKNKTATETKLIFDANGVYECSSQSDFVRYVGKKAIESGMVITAAVAPEFTISPAPFTEEQFNTALEAGILYRCEDNPTHKIGRLKSLNHICTKVETGTAYVSTAYYATIAAGKEGVDEVTGTHYGNQTAFELLGVGYTVLFKIIKISTDLSSSTFWECLKDKSIYDFRYIMTGGISDANVVKHIIDVATHDAEEKLTSTDIAGRGDCCALVDADETGMTQTNAITKIQSYCNNLKVDGKNILNKYSAVFAPKVTYDEANDDTVTGYGLNHTFPASVHFLVCAMYARSNKNYAEWYAVAGYNRGISEKIVKCTSVKLGEIAVNQLQPRIVSGDTKYAVNIITNIRGSYYMWGSRTAHKLQGDAGDNIENPGLVASHYLNIRDLCSSLKKDIYNICKRLTFDPNSDVLWGNFVNAAKQLPEKMKADQGIKDYKITKVKDSLRSLLTAKIRIVPIEPVEDFDISIFLEDSISGDIEAVEEE